MGRRVFYGGVDLNPLSTVRSPQSAVRGPTSAIFIEGLNGVVAITVMG